MERPGEKFVGSLEYRNERVVARQRKFHKEIENQIVIRKQGITGSKIKGVGKEAEITETGNFER